MMQFHAFSDLSETMIDDFPLILLSVTRMLLCDTEIWLVGFTMMAKVAARSGLASSSLVKANLSLLNLEPSFQYTSKLILKQLARRSKIEESISSSPMMGISFSMHILATNSLQHSLNATTESVLRRHYPMGPSPFPLSTSLNPLIIRPLVKQLPSRKPSLQMSCFRLLIFLWLRVVQRCSKMRMVNISQKVKFSRLTPCLKCFLM